MSNPIDPTTVNFMEIPPQELLAHAVAAGNVLDELARQGIYPTPWDGTPFTDALNRLEYALQARDEELWEFTLDGLSDEIDDFIMENPDYDGDGFDW